jgi:subtilisin family serine protease
MTEQSAAWWENRELARERLRRHVEIIRAARPEVAVTSGGWDAPADTMHMHRDGAILVRDADLDRVRAIVPGEVEASLINGVTLYRPRYLDTEAALTQIDRQLGVGVATPDHVVHVTSNSGACPATEPDAVDLPPYPAVNEDPASDGTGVLVSVVDTGLLPGVAAQHSWLSGVDGDEEQFDAANIAPFVGHGTFVAGVVRCMAPKADIRVEGFLTHGGTVFESEIVTQLDEALDRVPDVICLSAGTTTRRNLNLLGFDAFWENRLQYYKGTVLVAAAGNDMDRGPFWPAAFPWAVSVGAVDQQDERAPFSNYGSWVDVYAPGVDVVNAFPDGTYTYQEGRRAGQQQQFTHGMAQWSGTSFATPVVAGMIASRMSVTGETARQAADALLVIARQNAQPRVGAILRPDLGGLDTRVS